VTVDDVLDDVLAKEGGYVNDPLDAGGETNHGITIATARANGYKGPMRDMPQSVARDILFRRYVVAPGFDKVAVISAKIAAELVDTGVNMGPDTAGKILQRCLNSLNNNGRDFAVLDVDGDVGKASRAALKVFLARRGDLGEARLLVLLNALQGERYVSLTETRAANKAFMFGWLARIMP